jgi:hypothetical protein
MEALMAYQRPDQIDVDQSVFNEDGQLWNDNNSAVIVPRRYLVPIDDTKQLPGIVKDNGRETVLRDFAAVPSDLPSEKVSDGRVDIARMPVTGSFSAVRAARVLHQHQIKFWSDSGVIDSTTATNKADPSSDDINTMYARFLAFNYLPPSMTPSIDEFTTLVAPSKAPQNVKNALPNMGINISPASKTNQAFVQSTVSAPVQLPGNVPFANSLSSFCSQN